MASVVDLIVRLKDQASAGLGSISGRLGRLGGSGSVANASMKDLGGTIAGSILQANLLGAAFGAVGQGVSFVQGKIQEATNLQLDQLTATTTFSSLTGKSFDESAAFIDRLNNRLAKSAAALPGVTQDYKSLAIAIQDNVLEAFKGVNGQVDMKGFENTVAGISESYGALAAASNVPVSNLKLGLTKALGGASTASLRQIQFFEQNGIILNEIDKRLAKMGKKSLADLNIKDRVKLLEEVGQKFITEDFKREAGKSVDGLIQSFKSSIFDPSTGIFGLMRDLDPKTKGAQSAFSAYNDALIVLIGPDGLFNKMGQLFEAAGIQMVDPMALLKGGIDFFVSAVKGVNSIVDIAVKGLTGVKTGFTSFDRVGESIQSAINDRLNSFVAGMGVSLGIDVTSPGAAISSIFMRLGGAIYEGLQVVTPFLTGVINRAASGISGLLETFDFHGVGVAAGLLLGIIGGKIVDVIARLNYADILVGIGRLAIGVVQLAAGAIGGMALGIAPSILSAVGHLGGVVAGGLGLFFMATGQTVSDVFAPLFGLFSTRFSEGVALVTGIFEFNLGALNALVSGGISGWMQYMKDAAVNFFAGVAAAIAPTFSNGVTGVVEMVTSKINEFIGFLNQAIAGALDQLRNIPGLDRILPASAPTIPTIGGAPPATAPTTPAPLSFTMASAPVVASAVVANTPVGPPAPGVKPAAATPATLNTLFKPSGFAISAAPMFGGTPSFAAAVAAESRNAPTGASLVVANSSEVVLNRQQAATMSGRRGGNSNTFNFNISGANPQETWAFIKAQIEAEISGALT